jgi:hypothetical protein
MNMAVTNWRAAMAIRETGALSPAIKGKKPPADDQRPKIIPPNTPANPPTTIAPPPMELCLPWRLYQPTANSECHTDGHSQAE